MTDPENWRAISKQYECGVCLESPVVPYQICKAGHHACRTCSARLDSCHLCRGTLLEEPVRNLFAVQLLDKLTGTYTCSVCDRITDGTAEGLHATICEMAMVACSDCNELVRRGDMGLHATICEMAMVACSDCNEPVRRGDMGLHATICDMATVTCTIERCRARVRRKNMVMHDQTYHRQYRQLMEPFQVVQCPHCEWRMCAGSLPVHITRAH